MNDKEIIEKAICFVNEGMKVTLPVSGQSMQPFIVGDKESVVLTQPSYLRRGDVVLAFVDGVRYVVHRIVDIDGDTVTLMGDGNITGREHCRHSDIKALVTHVVDERGQQHDIYNNRWCRWAVRTWNVLLPARRYLLAIYRRL